MSLQARFGFAAITAVIMGDELRDRPQQPGNRRCSFAPPGTTASMTGTQTRNARHLTGRGSRPPARDDATVLVQRVPQLGGCRDRLPVRTIDAWPGFTARSGSLAAAAPVAPTRATTRHGVSGAWAPP